jgi:hypothetical protein
MLSILRMSNVVWALINAASVFRAEAFAYKASGQVRSVGDGVLEDGRQYLYWKRVNTAHVGLR